MESTLPQPETSVQTDEDLNLAMADLLKSSKWMKFMAVTGFVFLGIVALLALLCLAAPRGFLISGILIVVDLVLLFPALFLFKYARGIQNHKQTGNPETLETAFENQLKLWKYYCIGMVICFVIIAGLVAVFGINFMDSLKHIR